MFSLITRSAIIAALALVSGSAIAADADSPKNSFCVEIGGGVADIVLPSGGYEEVGGIQLPFDFNVDGERGRIIQGKLCYERKTPLGAFSTGFRFADIDADIRQVDASGLPLTRTPGDMSLTSFQVVGGYDPDWEVFNPFVELGAGLGRFCIDSVTEACDTVPLGLFGAGFKVDVSSQVAVKLAYYYQFALDDGPDIGDIRFDDIETDALLLEFVLTPDMFKF